MTLTSCTSVSIDGAITRRKRGEGNYTTGFDRIASGVPPVRRQAYRWSDSDGSTPELICKRQPEGLLRLTTARFDQAQDLKKMTIGGRKARRTMPPPGRIYGPFTNWNAAGADATLDGARLIDNACAADWVPDLGFAAGMVTCGRMQSFRKLLRILTLLHSPDQTVMILSTRDSKHFFALIFLRSPAAAVNFSGPEAVPSIRGRIQIVPCDRACLGGNHLQRQMDEPSCINPTSILFRPCWHDRTSCALMMSPALAVTLRII